jgi:hypothetical protein
MKRFYPIVSLAAMVILHLGLPIKVFSQKTISTDVLVAGGGTGGIAAAIQSARMGVQTLIVERTHWLGGMMTAAGVSCMDGNRDLPSGLWKEFREALYQHYQTKNLATGWVSDVCFEPHVGDSIFKGWAAKEKKLRVVYGWWIKRVIKKQNRITGVVFQNLHHELLTVHARVTIDATELGDVFAQAGAGYDLGTEDPAKSGEKMAPGKTDFIQDLTWVAILQDYGSGHNETIPKPPGYDPTQFYCCCLSAPCKVGKPYMVDAAKMMAYGRLPHDKYMINWPAHGNDSYLNVVEQAEQARQIDYDSARRRTLAFVYFIQTQLGFSQLGLAKDELDQGLALIPYNREGRRLKGVIRFSINDILDPYHQPDKLYRTGISVGNYPVDHHRGQNPNTPKIDFPPIPSFGVPLGTLVAEKMDGLIVCEKGISVSNIVNGATRLQPVVLLTGQAAGMLASLSILRNCQPRQVDVRSIQQLLLDQGCYLMPYSDVPADRSDWKSIQRVGATGILRGEGRPQGWENKTLFHPDSLISGKDFETGAESYFDCAFGFGGDSLLAVGDVLRWAAQMGAKINPSTRLDFSNPDKTLKKIWDSVGLTGFDNQRPIKRGELAVLLDKYVEVFNRRKIDMRGFFREP